MVFESQSKNTGRAEKSRLKKESTLNENPAVIATAARMAIQTAKGKKVSVNTARQSKYASTDPSTHKKAKSIFQRIKDKFSKKKDDKPKKKSTPTTAPDFRRSRKESVDERKFNHKKAGDDYMGGANSPKGDTEMFSDKKGKYYIWVKPKGKKAKYIDLPKRIKSRSDADNFHDKIKKSMGESVNERIPAGEQKLVYQFKKLSTSQMDELDAMFARAGINGVPDFNKKTWSTYANRDAMKLKKNKTLQKFIKLKGGQQIKEGFGGELKGSAKKKFENDRKKNGEQLGYTLTGESDVKEILQRVVKEEVFNILEDKDIGHQDDEPDMLKKTALEITEYGKKLHDALDKYDDMDTEVDFPNWWQSKLILSKDYLQKAYHYLDSEEKTESVNERMDKRQAGETLKQLGGNKFIAMTGAKNFAVGPKGMGFKIGRNSKSINYVRIDLKSNDLYDMEFIRLRKSQIKVVKRVTGVYNDQLQKMFTKYTGMYTSL